MAISHCYWFHIATDVYWSRIGYCYWHLVVYTLLLMSTRSKMAISHCYWWLLGQEWQFHIATDEWSRMETSHYYWCQRMAISHCYWHLMVMNGLISHCYWCLLGQEWQFHITTDVYWVKNGNFTLLLMTTGSRMAISHCYWHLLVMNGNFTLLLMSTVYLVKNGNFTLLLKSSGQEWQFHIATDVYSGQEWQFHFATDV